MWLLLELFLGTRSHGSFVEIGAFDGVTFSNSWGLASRGWTGVLVEPIPEFAELARRAHSQHGGVVVRQAAIGAEAGRLSLEVAGPYTSGNAGWTGGNPKLREGRVVQVEQITLDTLLREHGLTQELDVLIVDVEGYEESVFAGFAWHPLPAMVIVELTDVHPTVVATRATVAKISFDISGRGYQIVFKDDCNTVFVREDVWKSAMSVF